MEIKQHTSKKWVKEEIVRKIKNYLELIETKSVTYEKLCNADKAVLKEKCIALF